MLHRYAGMSIFRFSAEFRFCFFVFLTFRIFEKDFSLFFLNRQKECFFLFTDTPTVDCSKSFGKQSVTYWFAGMHFRFRSKFESTVSPLGTRNLTPAAMVRVGVQRGLPRRGGMGGGGGLVAGWRTARSDRKSFAHRTPAFAPHPFNPHHFTHMHACTHERIHSLTLSLTHTLSLSLIFRATNRYDSGCGQSLHATLAPKMLQSF